MAPDDLITFGQAVNFPLILSLIIILFGVAALIHVLFVSVVRHRRESGILKALGFVRRQVALTVLWQTVTVALIGVVVGVPVGIVVGRLVRRDFAQNLGVVAVPIVLGSTISVVALGALFVAALLAVWPALLAVRSHSATWQGEE
jgi:putative ABC transport system permease protein